jgi:hypothetical protein
MPLVGGIVRCTLIIKTTRSPQHHYKEVELITLNVMQVNFVVYFKHEACLSKPGKITVSLQFLLCTVSPTLKAPLLLVSFSYRPCMVPNSFSMTPLKAFSVTVSTKHEACLQARENYCLPSVSFVHSVPYFKSTTPSCFAFILTTLAP